MGLNPHPSPAGAQDKNQLRVQGLAFGLAFQTLFKISAMYSVDHPAAARAVQQSWDLLAPLLKLGGQFTFGFMNQRVLLNSSLASHTHLTSLEVEFSKREIGALTFQPTVTLKDFKRALALITTRPTVIAERGGIKKLLAGNPIEGVQISPAVKPKEEGGMIDVGEALGSYLSAQAILAPGAGSAAVALDVLLEATGVKKPQGFSGSPQEWVAMAIEATRHTVANPEGDLPEMLTSVAQMLSGLKPDSLLASLPAEKQTEFGGQSPEVMAAQLVEDAIAGWVTERLGMAVQTGSSGLIAGPGSPASGDRDILQALLRGLKATRNPDRLLQKLAQSIERADLSKEVYERVHREVAWFTLPAERKRAQLLSLGEYTPLEFSRLVQCVQEAMTEGRFAEVAELAQHYSSTWEKAPSAVRAEELKRAPELLRVLASVQTLPLMHTLAEGLLREILDETRLHWPCHLEATNCLAIVAQNVGRFEDFEFVHKIASDLKHLLSRRPGQHADCCGRALAGFLTPEALERLVESFLQRRGDPAWVHTATSLLTIIGPLGAEAAHHRLDEEPAASNRYPLIRLLRGMGACAIEPTRKRLSDQRWEVVRNAAIILGDLGDPELPTQLRGALRHPEVRVQQAAITSLLKCNVAGRGEILAEALTSLDASLLEMALDELTMLKDPASVEHLEALVRGKKELKAGVLQKAVIALGAVPSDRAAEGLYKIIADAAQPLLVRRAALGSLYNHGSPKAGGFITKLSNLPASDPLSAEVGWSFPTG